MEINKSRMQTKVFLGVLIAFLLISVIGVTHATSLGIYTSPANVTLNTSSSLQHVSVVVFGNQSMTVNPISQSNNIFFSVSKFNISSHSGYNFTFIVNASSAFNSSIKFDTNTSLSYTLPVYIEQVKTAQQNVSYSISVVGTIASYHTVTISVQNKQNGSLMTSGELVIQFDGNSTSKLLSSNPFPSVSFGNLYGQVTIEYIDPLKSVGAYEVINTGNAVENKAPLFASCNLRPVTITGINASTIPTYSVSPSQNITCTLLDTSDNTFPQGVASYILMNGQEYDPQPSNVMGQVTFPYPQGGWPVGTLVFKTASSSYSLGDAFISVTPYPNPLEITFNGIATTQTTLDGNKIQVIPNILQDIQVSYPNGTTIHYNTDQPFTVSAVGTVKITATNSSYNTFSTEINLKQIPLDLVTNSSSIYTYRTYRFILENGGSVYDYSGPVYVGGTELMFSNGVASGFLSSTNTSSNITNGEYLVSPQFSVGLDPVDVLLPNRVYAHQIYRFYIESNNSIVPFSGYLLVKQDNITAKVPVNDGIGVLSFNSTDPAMISINSSTISPFQQSIDPINPTPFYMQIWFPVIVVLGVLLFLLIPRIQKRREEKDYYGDYGELNLG